MPSSTATSVAHAVIGLASEARRKRRSVSPIVSSTSPSAATTAAATLATGQVVTSSSARTDQTAAPLISSATRNARSRLWRALRRGIAHRLVAVVEVGVRQPVGAAEALGDVLAGQLDVDAARPRALGPVGPHEAGDLAARRRRSGGSCGRTRR